MIFEKNVIVSILLILVAINCIISTNGTIINSEESFKNQRTFKFPKAFSFGAATAAYQIGAWNVDGKSQSIWDNMTHERPELVVDESNGDVGPDSYHFFKEDVKALKYVGHYRFSIAWTRILPDGFNVNQKGIDYYDQLINELIENNIEPVATMYHYDLPQFLEDMGGFLNPNFVEYFEVYADTLFKYFGSRIKMWITFNEPYDLCNDSYGTGFSIPLVNANNQGGEYICGHHLLWAHAKAYHLYKEKYYKDQQGKIGISLNSRFYFKKNASESDELVEKAIQFRLGWFANPIFGKSGNYPKVMIDEIAKNSKAEGRAWSRLPIMSESLQSYIKGSADFFGFNYYTSMLIERNADAEHVPPSWEKDAGIIMSADPTWPRAKSQWLYSVPLGLSGILQWIKNNYENPPVLITENGWSDNGELEDETRISYLYEHILVLGNVINTKDCNVIGYTVWSIIDNFEWLRGYSEKFGLFSVNMTSPLKKRTPKKSADFMKNMIKQRSVQVHQGLE